LLVVLVPTTVAPPGPLVDAVARLRTSYPESPVVLVGMGGLGKDVPGVTVYHAVDHAIEALAHAARYAEWRRTPPVAALPRDAARAEQAQLTAARLVTAEDRTRWLQADEQIALLRPYGLAPIGTVAMDPVSAAEAADQLGFPVAVKVADPHVVHKTDRGLVRVGLRSPAEVAEAVRAFAVALGVEQVPVLVQPIVDGVEIALGVTRDPGFGPLVMVAAGGVATGILDDRAFLLPPFSHQDAARAIRSLRVWPLLNGYRGAVRADVGALERMVVAIGDLASDVPQLSEMDLNPVMCRPDGVVLVDVKIGLAQASALDAGVPRRLRASI